MTFCESCNEEIKITDAIMHGEFPYCNICYDAILEVNSIYTKTNREKRLTPKKGGVYWCDFCDNAKVGHGQKCPACGKRNGKRTLKKESNS